MHYRYHAPRPIERHGWCNACAAAEILIDDAAERHLSCDTCGSEDVEVMSDEALDQRELAAAEMRFLLATLDTAISWWGLDCTYQAATMLGSLVRAVEAWEPEDATLGELYVAAMALRDHAEDAAQ